MHSDAYVIGALDALVKSGEITPAYAGGVASILLKEADWTPWADSAGQNYTEEYKKMLAENPNIQRNSIGEAMFSQDQARELMRRSRHWYNDWQDRTKNWWSIRGDKFLNIFRGAGTKKDDAYYERWQRDEDNKILDRQRDRIAADGVKIHDSVAGAYQDATMGDALNRAADLGMDNESAKEYADERRSAAGDAAVNSGGYKATNYKTVAPGTTPQYGKDLSRRDYGKNADLFFKNNYRSTSSRL